MRPKQRMAKQITFGFDEPFEIDSKATWYLSDIEVQDIIDTYGVRDDIPFFFVKEVLQAVPDYELHDFMERGGARDIWDMYEQQVLVLAENIDDFLWSVVEDSWNMDAYMVGMTWDLIADQEPSPEVIRGSRFPGGRKPLFALEGTGFWEMYKLTSDDDIKVSVRDSTATESSEDFVRFYFPAPELQVDLPVEIVEALDKLDRDSRETVAQAVERGELGKNNTYAKTNCIGNHVFIAVDIPFGIIQEYLDSFNTGDTYDLHWTPGGGVLVLDPKGNPVLDKTWEQMVELVKKQKVLKSVNNVRDIREYLVEYGFIPANAQLVEAN